MLLLIDKINIISIIPLSLTEREMLFADVTTGEALGGSATVLIILNMLRDAWKDYWERREKRDKAKAEEDKEKRACEERLAKMKSDEVIAVATLKLTGDVQILNSKVEISEADRTELRKKIDECGIAHEETKKCQQETQKKLDDCEEKHQQTAEVQSKQRVDLTKVVQEVEVIKQNLGMINPSPL